jgi:tetratricopeptide (TPR) repeat protein
MQENLPVVYLFVLLVLLLGVAVFLIQQVFKTVRQEKAITRLQNLLKQNKATAKDAYELGSLYLDKKLYVQAIALFQKALKLNESETEPENKALIYNALGFSYFAQEQYDLSIRNYKDAIKLYPDYVVALNNLANTYEKKQMITKAIETYEETLKYDQSNKIARKRKEALSKRLAAS